MPFQIVHQTIRRPDGLELGLKDDLGESLGAEYVSQSGLDEAIDLWTSCLAGAGSWSKVKEAGEKLAEVLFPGDLRGCVQEAARRAQSEGTSLRLLFETTGVAHEEVPWEFVYLQSRSRAEPLDGFLGLQPRVSVARTLREGSLPAPKPGQKLKVLTVSADPGTSRFGRLAWLAAESRAVRASLHEAQQSRIELRQVVDAVPAVVLRQVKEFRPDVFQFSGHSETRLTGQELVLQGATPGTESFLGAEELASGLIRAGCKLAVLAACDTSGPSNSVAAVLHLAGVPFVVGMQCSVDDASQPQFSRTFYGALQEGATIEEAVSEARSSLAGTLLAWGAPTVYANCPSVSLLESRRSVGECPNNLPEDESDFIGRELEVADALRGLQESRWVTLTGPGGIGKTRLAQQAAKRLFDQYPDGVWFVSCDACATRDDVYGEVAVALNLRLQGDSSFEKVQSFLSDKRLLLLLDCFEGVVAQGEGSAVNDLLRAKRVACLVTSRSRTDLPSEFAIPIAPLPATDDSSSSVHLFLSRAGIDPRNLSREVRHEVAQICELLGGVPLALILAAARVRILEVGQLLDLLRQSALKTIDGYEGSFSVAISRSLELVPEADRYLLWKLCVFSGTFGWDDLLAVYEEDRFELLDGVARLTSNSLVQTTTTGGKKRFRVLDTVREYLAAIIRDESATSERLGASHRHSAWFATQAETVQVLMREGKWAEGTALLWPNLGNFRAAIAFASENERWLQIARFARSLGRTFMEAGLWSDFDRLCEDGYHACEKLTDPALRAQLLGLQGALAFRRGQPQLGKGLWMQRAELCRSIGDMGGHADVLLDLAALEYQEGRLVQCEELLDQLAPVLEEAKSTEMKATFAALKALCALGRDEFETATSWATEGEVLASTASDNDPMLFVLSSVARVRVRSGETERGQATAAKILKLALNGNRLTYVGIALTDLGEILERGGQIQLAQQCLTSAAASFSELGSKRAPKAKQELEAFWGRHGINSDAVSAAETERPWREFARELLEFVAPAEDLIIRR